jgi:hypothetical protein
VVVVDEVFELWQHNQNDTKIRILQRIKRAAHKSLEMTIEHYSTMTQ